MKFEKIELSGLIVLFIGVILLAFTFFSAFGFLSGSLNIITGDILEVFGEALGPLIEAIIRILYLGIMGWIGSIVTIRGVQLLKKEAAHTQQTQQCAQPESKQEQPKQEPPKQEQAKQESKPKNPETPPKEDKPKETTTPSSPTPPVTS